MRAASALAALAALAAAQDAVPTGLLADFQKSPAHLSRFTPHFTWIVPPCAASPDAAQTSYALTVRALSGATVWASGAQNDADSTYVAYAGPALNASSLYTWTVSTTAASCTSGDSAPAAFLTPLAAWAPGAAFISTPAPATFGYFRKEFTVPAGVVGAVAHVAAVNANSRLLSGYKLYINDAFVNLGPGRGEAPVWDGDGAFRALPYTTLDVTAALPAGGAAAVLALQAMNGGGPAVIFQLVLHLADGSTQTLVSDASWGAFNGDLHRKPGPAAHGGSAGTGFIEYNDARGEPVGWRAPGFTPGAQWAAAAAQAPSAAQLLDLHPHMQPPLQVAPMPLVSIVPGPAPPPPPPTGPVTCGRVPENSKLTLACPDGTSAITSVTFASFGTPTGFCPGHLAKGACDANASLAIVQKACVGKARCELAASTSVFSDPCYDTVKALAVEVTCPGTPPPPPPPPPSSPVSFLADFGKEFQGGLRLDVTNGTAGLNVSIACGEMLNADGSVGYTWGWEFTWVLRDGAQTLEQHKYMECRFVSITFDAPVDFALSAWRVNYPWDEADSAFASSNATLDAVYDLCRYTVHSAAIDTYTDSNTRERTPYEADGIIAASGRLLVQRDYLFGRHSHAYVLENPTWPVEWKQITPFLGWQDYQATGQPDLALAFTDKMHESTFLSFLDSTGVLNTTSACGLARKITKFLPEAHVWLFASLPLFPSYLRRDGPSHC